LQGGFLIKGGQIKSPADALKNVKTRLRRTWFHGIIVLAMKQLNSKDYTFNQCGYQLILPLDIATIIPSDDKVRLLNQFVEELDLADLYRTYERVRKSSASPRKLLKVVLYAAMNRLYSSRDIESACRRDINFMYLLEGSPAPDHATISRFKFLHFADLSQDFLAAMSEWLYKHGEISGRNIFIDGTKIESCANKYTFVWKKAVSKNLAKLADKATTLVEQCEEQYALKVVYDGKVNLHKLKRLRKKLYKLKAEENIEFVHGIGKRKTQLQRDTELLEEYIEKFKEYHKKIHVCGTRNSYSKTDTDATFMRMKEDAMLNGQLKPAYNLQHGVDAEYIVWATIHPLATDTNTLKPFIRSMEEHLSFKYTNIVADAGYESEENYTFLEDNGQVAFIKPTNYETSKTRKYKNDIGRAENMEYDADTDAYICSNGRKLTVDHTRKIHTKSGYTREVTVYQCEDCAECPYKTSCIKGNNCQTPMDQRTKRLEVAKRFLAQRNECLERITSEEGCMLRMNRSIQAEGSFSETKEGMGFRRYMSRGKKNVLAESILVAMARNMNKLHAKIQSGRTGTHLYPLKSA
jgi:transposase